MGRMRSRGSGRWRVALLLLAATLLPLHGCRGPETPVEYTVLDDGLAPLKAAFNADASNVRAVLLGAPT